MKIWRANIQTLACNIMAAGASCTSAHIFNLLTLVEEIEGGNAFDAKLLRQILRKRVAANQIAE